MATDRVKLGETPLVKSLRAVDAGSPSSMDEVIVCQTYCTELYRVPGEHFDVRRRLTPAGRALLDAAELWDSLPEPDDLYVAYAMMDPDDKLRGALRKVAAALEAKRRTEEANHD